MRWAAGRITGRREGQGRHLDSAQAESLHLGPVRPQQLRAGAPCRQRSMLAPGSMLIGRSPARLQRRIFTSWRGTGAERIGVEWPDDERVTCELAKTERMTTAGIAEQQVHARVVMRVKIRSSQGDQLLLTTHGPDRCYVQVTYLPSDLITLGTLSPRTV